MALQQPQQFQMPPLVRPFDTPVDCEENLNPPISDRDPQMKKSKSVPDTVKSVRQETKSTIQLMPRILEEAAFYSQVPLNLDQQTVLKCPNLTEDKSAESVESVDKSVEISSESTNRRISVSDSFSSKC